MKKPSEINSGEHVNNKLFLNSPVTISQIIPLQHPTYPMSHLLVAGFRGSNYQLLVLLDKIMELLINEQEFNAMVEVDGVGNLDDLAILKLNENKVVMVDAYQVKYYNHPIFAHDLFNKDVKITESANKKTEKMHIGKFFDGWLEWKNKYPNLPKEELNSILYTNNSVDEMLGSCIETGKFRNDFISGTKKIFVNRESKKTATVSQNFLRNFQSLEAGKITHHFSKHVYLQLQAKGFLDAEGKFTDKFNPNVHNFSLGLSNLDFPRKSQAIKSADIIGEIERRLKEEYKKNQVDFYKLLYDETWCYIQTRKLHLEIIPQNEEDKQNLFQEFLQSFIFHTKQGSIEDLETKIQDKLEIILNNSEYKNMSYQVSTAYLCFYYLIHEWFCKEYPNRQTPKLTNGIMKEFLQKSLTSSQDINYLQGQSQAILSNICFQIKGKSIPRPELNNLKEMLNKSQPLLLIGQNGIGKSALVKQVLRDRPSREYLIVNGRNIANNPDLQIMLLRALRLIKCIQVVVIDGAEHLSCTEILEFLSSIHDFSGTILLTLTNEFYKKIRNNIREIVSDINIFQVQPLNQRHILETFPELNQLQKVISLVNLAKIPFYLNLIVEQKNNIDLNFAASAPALLKDYIISLQVNDKELLHGVNKSKTLLQRFANRSLAASEIIFDIPRSFKFIAETLIRKGILIKIDSEKCMFSHDIYYNWAVDSWITSEFTRCVEIHDDWNQFLDQYSSYNLGNWFKKNIESICDNFLNFKMSSLTIDSIEKFLHITGVVIELQLDKKSGKILSSILFTIWQYSYKKKHELEAGIREVNITYNLLPKMFVKMNDEQIQTEKQIEKIFEYACVLQFLNFKHADSRFVELLTNINGYQSYKEIYGIQFSKEVLLSNFDLFELPEVRNILEKQAIDLLFKPMVYKAICQFNPKLFMQLLEKRFVMTDQSVCKIYAHKEIDYYFGLLESENWYPRYHKPVEFEKNPFFLLLATGKNDVIYSIINFVDNACNKFANSGYQGPYNTKDPLININFVISREKQITLKGNQLLWSLYLGSQPGLGIIKLALMSLDYWLLKQIEQNNDSVFIPVLDYVMEHSNTVATIAVVSSVCTAFKEKLVTIALLLLKYRKFFEWDDQRRSDEIHTVADSQDFRNDDLTALARHLMVYANNRLEILDIIDQHYKELPEIDKQTEQDKYWRIMLCSMDIRKHQVNRYDIPGSHDKLIEILPVLDDDLNEFLATKKQDNLELKNSLLKYDEIGSAARLLINKDDYVDAEQLVKCKNIIFEAINSTVNSDEHTKKISFNFNYNIVAEALVKIFLTSPSNEKSYEESKKYMVLGLIHASDTMRIAIVKHVGSNIWKKDPIFASKCIVFLFKFAILNFKKLYYPLEADSFGFVEKVNDLISCILNEENFHEEYDEFNFAIDYDMGFPIIGDNAFAQNKIVELALLIASYNFKNEISKKLYFAYLAEIIKCRYNPPKNTTLDLNFQLISSSLNLPYYPFAFSGLIGQFLISLPFDEAKLYIKSMISISKNWEHTRSNHYGFYNTGKDFIQDLLESLLKSAAKPKGFWLLWDYLFIQKDISSKLLEVFLDRRLFCYIDSSGAYDQFVMKAAEKNIKQFKNSNLFEKWLVLAQQISPENILKVVEIINRVLENNSSFISKDSIQNNILYALINIFSENKNYIENDEIVNEKILFLINKFSNKSFVAGIMHSKLIEHSNQLQQQIMSTSVRHKPLVSSTKRTYSEMSALKDGIHNISIKTEDSTSRCFGIVNPQENKHEEAQHDFKRQRKNSDFKLTQFELSKKQEKGCVSNVYEEGSICSSQSLEVVNMPTIVTTQEVNCKMLPYYSHQLDHNDRAYIAKTEQPLKLRYPLISEEYKSKRTGLKSVSDIQIREMLKLPEEYTIGEAIDNGGCFFDSFAQLLNTYNNTEEYTEKSLRLACCDYVSKNSAAAISLINADKNSNISFANYDEKMSKTGEEIEVPQWGRTDVEGIMLCRQLDLDKFYVYEIGKDLYGAEFCSLCEVTQEKVTNIGLFDLDLNKPTLIVKDLHFVPILPYKLNILSRFVRCGQ